MAANRQPHRAIALGLSGGIGLTVPLVAYAATLPFDAAHDIVRASGLPFAVGVIAGAGVFALAERFYAPDAAPSEQDAPAAEGATFIPLEQEPAREAADAARTGFFSRIDAEPEAGRTGFFARRHREDDGVPTIQRAADAMSEEEAWAEIDSLMSAGSPISCDARTSRDIYQIAFDELSRAAAPTDAAATAAAAAPAAAAATAATAAAAPAEPAQQDPSFDPFAYHPEVPEPDADQPREAAAPADSTAVFIAAASMPAAVTTALPMEDFDLDEPSGVFAAKSASDPVDAEPAHRVPVQAAPAEAAPEPVDDVPVADYSGHEDMWAAALAVLAEDAPAGEAFAPAAPKRPAAHMAPAAPDDEDAAQRARAVAEGERSTRMHARVNEILGEEVDKVDSQSMRRTAHEYLRVIQGGTISMPRVPVEA